MRWSAPVIADARSLTRKATSSATSAGRVGRPRGMPPSVHQLTQGGVTVVGEPACQPGHQRVGRGGGLGQLELVVPGGLVQGRKPAGAGVRATRDVHDHVRAAEAFGHPAAHDLGALGCGEVGGDERRGVGRRLGRGLARHPEHDRPGVGRIMSFIPPTVQSPATGESRLE